MTGQPFRSPSPGKFCQKEPAESMWKPVQDTDDCARSIGHADARLRLLIYPSQSAIYLVKIRFDNRLNRMVVVFVGERNWMNTVEGVEMLHTLRRSESKKREKARYR
jgi:hypothetical protein